MHNSKPDIACGFCAGSAGVRCLQCCVALKQIEGLKQSPAEPFHWLDASWCSIAVPDPADSFDSSATVSAELRCPSKDLEYTK